MYNKNINPFNGSSYLYCVTNINIWLHSNIFHSIINGKKRRICNTHILPYALPTNEHVVSLFLRHLCITWKESRILKWHCFSWGLKILLILKNADSISLKMGEQQHQQHKTYYNTTHITNYLLLLYNLFQGLKLFYALCRRKKEKLSSEISTRGTLSKSYWRK